MSKKGYIVIVFFIGLVVGEIHQFRYLPNKEVNWFIYPPHHLPTVTWYLKDIGSIIQRLLWVYGAFLIAKMVDKRLADVLRIFILYCILDGFLYVFCYQLYGYSAVYGLMGLFTFYILRKK